MRLFIAIPVDCEGLSKAQSQLPNSVRKVNDFHVTLKFFGESDIEHIKKRLESFSFKPFSFSIDRVKYFSRNGKINVIWAGICPEQPLIDIAKQLEKLFPEYEDDYEYKPHITLARTHIDEKQWRPVELQKTMIRVDKVVLYSSELTAQGPSYTAQLDIHGA